VDFTTGRGNANTAYGIPAANVDYVLRAMMDQQISAINSNATADSAFDILQGVNGQNGISVAIPGVAGSYSNVILASNTTAAVGTVFDDSSSDRITVGGDNQGWVFFSTSNPTPDVVTDLAKARRKTVSNRRNP